MLQGDNRVRFAGYKECHLVSRYNYIAPNDDIDSIRTTNYWLVPGFESRSCRPVLSKHPLKHFLMTSDASGIETA